MNDRLQFLFNKYIADEITPEEKSELSRLIRVTNNQEVSELLKEEWEKTGDDQSVLSSSEAESILEQIIGAKNTAKEVASVRVFQQTWFRVAAAVLFMIGLFVLYNLTGDANNNEPVIAQKKTSTQIISPGGNKAILTLADGSTIILDSANNGSIAQQGQSNIIKLEDGQLAYKDGGSNSGSAAIQYNTVSTPRGGQYQLVLADGSKVWLNAESSIRFPTSFTGQERNVEITGEVYFEVAHNASKPFIVRANEVEIKVLGTSLNVNAYEDEGEIKTTLLEGSVKINKEKQSIIIKPGEQVLARKGTGLTVKDGVDVEAVVAWKDGYFQFENLSIKEIMWQLSRWYNVDVIYEGKVPAGHYVGKPSRDLNLSEILKVIELSGVKIAVNGKTIIVKE